jgi:hypothetical protein
MTTRTGKALLDNAASFDTEARAARYADIARRQGETIGQKEMALTRRPRDEDASLRAKKFIEIERRGE